MKKFLSIFLILTIIILSGCTPKTIFTLDTIKVENKVNKETTITALTTNKPIFNIKVDTTDESLVGDTIIIPKIESLPPVSVVTPQAISAIKSTNKSVFLTIDDGPSSTTGEILDILDKYDVKATFFVTAQNYPKVKGMYAEIKRRGHTIGAHSYTHSYALVYSSVANFFNDLDRLNKILLEETGSIPSLLRFPGGSNNHSSWQYSGPNFMKDKLIPAVLKKGYVYFDWNSVGNDAMIINPSKDYIVNQVFSTTKNLPNVIVLLHDINIPGTLAALPIIIQRFKSEGYAFKMLSTTSYKVQFNK